MVLSRCPEVCADILQGSYFGVGAGEFGIEFQSRGDLVGLLGGGANRATLVVLNERDSNVRRGHHETEVGLGLSSHRVWGFLSCVGA